MISDFIAKYNHGCESTLKNLYSECRTLIWYVVPAVSED